MKYVCTVCGYVYEGDSLPADFVCPVCKAPADKFLAQGRWQGMGSRACQ